MRTNLRRLALRTLALAGLLLGLAPATEAFTIINFDDPVVRKVSIGPDAPDELLTASASGLDPHLSPAAAKHQAPRVAAARRLAPGKVESLIESLTESPQFGLLGEPRVNVLALNLALDRME